MQSPPLNDRDAVAAMFTPSPYNRDAGVNREKWSLIPDAKRKPRNRQVPTPVARSCDADEKTKCVEAGRDAGVKTGGGAGALGGAAAGALAGSWFPVVGTIIGLSLIHI